MVADLSACGLSAQRPPHAPATLTIDNKCLFPFCDPPALAAVIRHAKQLAYEKLPSVGEKSKTHPGNAMAAAAFDAPEFISGTVSGVRQLM